MNSLWLIFMFSLKFVFYVIMIFFCIHSSPSYADSNDTDAFIGPLCNIVVKVQGPWGKALLVVGAIFVGVNVFVGKFSFPMLIGFIAAGALILSPQAVINVLGGGEKFDCATYKTSSQGSTQASTTK